MPAPFFSFPLLTVYSPYHLAAQVARHVGDVYPSAVALPYQLRETYLPLLLHLLDELEQAAVVGTVAGDDIRCAADDVVAVLHASDERVELLAAVATAHHDRLSPRFADGVEELLHQHVQQVVCALRWAIVDVPRAAAAR